MVFGIRVVAPLVRTSTPLSLRSRSYNTLSPELAAVSDPSALFAPERVAVVGASEERGSVGRAITTGLREEFDGEVVPVNPNHETVLGQPCMDGLAEAEAVDLAVVVVPPAAVLDVVREAGETGVESVVVITAGFAEAGGEGATRERELRAVAAEYDLNLVGPNSLGLISTPVGLNASFGPGDVLPGGFSFMSQSGAFVTAVIDWARDQGVGFRHIVSLGNEAVLDERDFVEAWGEGETSVILGYLEGIDDGQAFIETAREVSRETPIVLVKSGRTEAGARAASSHTGSIAGSDRAYEAGLDQAGVLRTETAEELFDVARALDGLPVPASGEVAVVTNAGGPGVMATDATDDSDLELAAFADGTIDALRETLPETANVYNPVDVIGDAPAERFDKALEIVLDDPNVGTALVLAAPTNVLDFGALGERIVERRTASDLPIAACLMGGASMEPARERLNTAGMPTYFDPSRAIRSLEACWRYREVRDRKYVAPAEFDVDRERVREELERASRETNRVGVEAMELFDAYGIPTPDGEVVEEPAEAVGVAQDIDGEVVMKVVSPGIQHKSDIGGVRVGVPNEAVYDTYEDLVSRARNYQPDATILSVQVQETIDPDAGTETIVGMNRDPQFGPVVLFGLGGIFVEVLEDVSVRVAPVTEPEARSMIDELDAAPVLRGARGRDPIDETAVVETIQRLSQLVTEFPAILELDVNPLVATPEGCVAIDLAATIDPGEL
jgi:acetyltransferase